MTELANDRFIQAQARAVGTFERIITGLHQQLNALGTGPKQRGKKSIDEAEWIESRRARIENEIEWCQRYRMEAMRDIGIPVPTIAVMVGRTADEVESAIRLVQYDKIPPHCEPVIAAGKDIEPVKH